MKPSKPPVLAVLVVTLTALGWIAGAACLTEVAILHCGAATENELHARSEARLCSVRWGSIHSQGNPLQPSSSAPSRASSYLPLG